MNAQQTAWTGVVLLIGPLVLSGCGTGTGPGSTADALEFANNRIMQLKQRATEEDEDGKWHCEAMELRNAAPGFNQSTAVGVTSVEATVEYEYRILRSGPHETKTEADSSKLEPEKSDWEKKKEVYIFKDGEWTSRDAK